MELKNINLKSAMRGSSSGTSAAKILLNSIWRFPGAFPLKTFKSVFFDEVRRVFSFLLPETEISCDTSARPDTFSTCKRSNFCSLPLNLHNLTSI